MAPAHHAGSAHAPWPGVDNTIGWWHACQTGRVPQRFLKLPDVCEVLNISTSQAYALVNSGDLPAIQIGGRNQWRVEASELESYIQRMYEETRERIEREREAADRERSVEVAPSPEDEPEDGEA
ncbi:MAG: helix-turn-helix domain-containing protein [Actinomycetales bacterium]|nr:helix-turn-helix domain-containing protein [Actinomycetales bacterium]